jgi:hypothetical protein
MAEKLPRYRPLGVSIASVPAIDFAGAKMKARGFDQTAAALDKISSFAFKKAGEYKVEEAQKFRYDNPVTAEQLQTAISSGRDIDEIIGDNYTIFGRASRATVGVQLKTQLENQAKRQLSAINAAVEGGQDIDIGAIQTQFDGMLNGHANLLAEIDPNKAYEYSATMNTLASATYRNALERQYKLQQSAIKDTANEALEVLPNMIKQIISADAGAMVTLPDGQIVPQVELEVAALLRSTNDTIIATNDPEFIASERGKVRGLIRTAKSDVLVDYALDGGAPVDIAAGNFGRYSNLYASLTTAEQAEVRKQIRTERSARISSRKSENEERDNSYNKDAQKFMNEMVDSEYNSPAYNAAKTNLESIAIASNGKATSISAINTLDASLSTASGRVATTPPPIFNTVHNEILTNQIINVDGLNKRMEELGVSALDQVKLREMIDPQNKKREIAITKAANQMAKIVPAPGFQPSQQQAKTFVAAQAAMQQRYEAAFSEWNALSDDEKRTTPIPDIQKIANDYRTDVLKSIPQKNIDAILGKLNFEFAEKLNITIDESTDIRVITDNASTFGLSKTQIDDLKRRMNSIKALIRQRDSIQ